MSNQKIHSLPFHSELVPFSSPILLPLENHVGSLSSGGVKLMWMVKKTENSLKPPSLRVSQLILHATANVPHMRLSWAISYSKSTPSHSGSWTVGSWDPFGRQLNRLNLQFKRHLGEHLMIHIAKSPRLYSIIDTSIVLLFLTLSPLRIVERGLPKGRQEKDIIPGQRVTWIPLHVLILLS